MLLAPAPLEIESVAREIPALQETWRRLATRRPLPWYVEEKLGAGSFAALLCVELNDARTAGVPPALESKTYSEPVAGETPAVVGELLALAAGDSCLAQVRQEEIVARFPLEHSTQFSSRPVLLPSHPAHNDSLADRLRTFRGEVRPGDELYLMTDALACWFYASCENGGRPWEVLRAVAQDSDSGAFSAWLNALRGERVIKNDDVTLALIEVLE